AAEAEVVLAAAGDRIQGEAELDVAAAALRRTAFDFAHLVDGPVVLDHVSLLDVVSLHAGRCSMLGMAAAGRWRRGGGRRRAAAADFRRSAMRAPHPARPRMPGQRGGSALAKPPFRAVLL